MKNVGYKCEEVTKMCLVKVQLRLVGLELVRISISN